MSASITKSEFPFFVAGQTRRIEVMQDSENIGLDALEKADRRCQIQVGHSGDRFLWAALKEPMACKLVTWMHLT
jgi:hypothetical protein